MRHPSGLILATIAAWSVPAWCAAGEECTTAVVSGAAAADGRPLLWKNRDTDSRSNKVVYVAEEPHSYLAVVDPDSASGRVAWGGLNSAGFAVINSMSYNLPQDSGQKKDLEGIVMGDALRLCATVDDFERYLRANLGPEIGSRTNFCAIDGRGGAAIFEVHNHGLSRLEASVPPEKYLLNTNFSRSGKKDGGAGYLRFDRATELFRQAAPAAVTHEFILQDVSRDLEHSLLRHPPRSSWKEFPAATPVWIHADHTIDRPSTASAILIHGAKDGEDPRRATLWVILGEPVCSIAVPLWVAAGAVPPELCEGEEAPIAREALRLEAILHPLAGKDREAYLDITRLDNSAGTGWLPGNLSLEREILKSAERFLSNERTAEELATHEREAAAKVLARLRAVK
jgi:hypothetical protein